MTKKSALGRLANACSLHRVGIIQAKTPGREGMRLSQRVGGLLRGNALEAPPDGGWGWLVVLGGFTIHFNCLGLQYTFGILFKALLDDEALQRASGSTGGTAASTWAGSISACLMLLGSFPAGFLVRRCGMRVTALSGAVFMFSGYNAWIFRSCSTVGMRTLTSVLDQG